MERVGVKTGLRIEYIDPKTVLYLYLGLFLESVTDLSYEHRIYPSSLFRPDRIYRFYP